MHNIIDELKQTAAKRERDADILQKRLERYRSEAKEMRQVATELGKEVFPTFCTQQADTQAAEKGHETVKRS